jgi:hypothetical protein
MSAARTSYTDDEIRAFSNMSYWELDRRGLLTSGESDTRDGFGRTVFTKSPAGQRIERGPGSYVARRKPARDYLSEPLSELNWRL